jgi:hypothetical protein
VLATGAVQFHTVVDVVGSPGYAECPARWFPDFLLQLSQQTELIQQIDSEALH